MSRVPVLCGLQVSCQDAEVHLGWRWAGRKQPQVRVLRSLECFCDSPDSHLTGEWGQELAYEGDGGQLLDAHADRGHDLYYSIFARHAARDPWRRPVRICVRKAGYEPPALGVKAVEGGIAAALYAPGRSVGDRYVEIGGSDEAAPAVQGGRDWLLIFVPVVTLALLAGFLRGLDVRLLTVAALALAACWRLLDGPHPDLRRFLTYLRVVAVVDGFCWAAAALLSFFVAVLPAGQVRIDHSILLFWLYPLLLLAGMAGVWLFMSLALDDQGRPAHLAPFAGLAALLGVAAVLPVLAGTVAAVFAVCDYTVASRAIRRAGASHEAELRDARRQTVRDVYLPWLAEDDQVAPEGSPGAPPT